MGDLSQHFSRAEFVCPDYQEGGVTPQLVTILENLRHVVGDKPLHIVSGFRCFPHNRAVGGASDSRHLHGDAADIPVGYATVAQAERAGAVGIGNSGPWAVHVDWRPGRPARWTYDTTGHWH